MNNILSRNNQHVLAQYASSNVLLAFDYDGTLAPIVGDPVRAAMRQKTLSLLRQLSEAYPCVVISGRAKADLSKRLRDAPAVRIVGNHGIEPFAATEKFAQAVRRWQPFLQSALSSHDGVQVEDKVFSVAIHYRRSRTRRRAREAIARVIDSLDGARLIGGKLVVNVLPEGAPHKGMALERERARLGCDTAIYIGDDDTDEDVFMLDQPGRLLKVRVGHSRQSMADFAIRSQRDLDDLLDRLLQLRKKPIVGRRVVNGIEHRARMPTSAASGLPALGEVLEFLRLLWGLDHAMQRTSKRMETRLGVTGPQRLAIRLVGRFPGILAGDLAKILHVHPATLTGILQRLERSRLVTRQQDPHDRRRARLGLTSKGASIDTADAGTVEAAVRRALEGVAGSDVKGAVRLLGKLAEELHTTLETRSPRVPSSHPTA